MLNQYVLILVWIGFMAILQGSFYREEYNELIGDYEWRVKPFFAFIVAVPLIFMAAFRGNIGDTYAYIGSYHNMPDSFLEISSYIATVKKDRGFYYFSAILRCVFGYNAAPYLFTIAAIQGYILAKYYKKYSSDFVFSMFLFIASSDYIGWMFNGVRQFMAVVIILIAVPYMLADVKRGVIRKYLPIVLIVIIASTMHQSALLMIPFILIAQGEAYNKKTFLFIILALVAVTYVGEFTILMNDTLQTTQYANVVSDFKAWNDDGTNPIRVLVYSIPAILAFYGRTQIRNGGNVIINFSANMSIISMGLYLVSMVTSGIFIGRLPIYCSLFNYILFPWEIDNLFSYNTGRMIRFVTIIGYLGFYYYFLHFQNGFF